MKSPLIIDYYSDVLCVWAWIAQRRLDELNSQFGNRIDIHYHYLDVFGDAINKIPSQWQNKGGYQGFSAHVLASASSFEDAKVSPDIWSKVRPKSSANPHLVLKAIEQSYSKQTAIELALQFRKAFFIDAQDISRLDVLFNLITQAGLEREQINNKVIDGSAMAALMGDYQQAKTLTLKGSPTYIIDNGRQTLYGNIGFRVLSANIEALLEKPQDDASWC